MIQVNLFYYCYHNIVFIRFANSGFPWTRYLSLFILKDFLGEEELNEALHNFQF